ncbi:hypothetical protein BGX26_002680 [Mortierella sp. AD094]|nr:hypothetical protein BGX26_002680 [Mortierella sp. AD094]
MSKREKAKAFLKALIHHDKPEKHEDIHVISQKIYSLQPGNTGSIRHASSATSVGSSRIAIADCQGIPDSDIVPTLPKHTQDETLNKPENVIKLDVIKAENTINPENVRPNPIEPIVHITPYIFEKTLAPQIAKFPLPEVGSRIAGTPQLAYYLSLLPSSLESGTLDETKFNQLQVYLKDPDEKERLQKMARSLVGAFIQDKSKNPDVVAEVVSLAAVLDKDDFRKLLQTLVNGIDHSVLLDVHLLNGLAQLIQNAERGHIDAADLIEILKLLNSRYTHIKDSLSQSSQHAYQLVLTISHVLDSMVDSQVKGLSRETLHEPLSEYLKGLKESPDSFYVYQAAYAYQALQCIPDDETFLKKTIRRTGKVIQGISGVVSAVKGLDLDKFIEGLQNIQGGFAGAEEAFVFVKGAYENVKKLSESGHGLFESLKESFDIAHKCAWYPALRVADKLIQDGRFSDFEKLVRRAACKLDPAFQWGVSQRLGEIAVNIFWDVKVRQCAVTFLGELYKDDATWGQQASIKQWILSILGQLEDPSNEIISNQARELLRELETDGSVEKRLLYQGYKKDGPGLYPMIVSLPPHKSPLLEFVQNKPDVETPLHQLKLERLRSQSKDVYISPIAKSSPRDTEGFDLMTKVEEFLKSNRKVFLILGDSGAGKSTFNRALEISLWDNYKPDSPIPLFISLPTIENPVHGLISKRLKDAKFTDEQILELKNCHDFILICDGYDECQQTRNLYESNMLNQPGGWRVQMVISCRTEYNGVDYKYRFLPTDQNSSGNEDQFEEAIIAPFSRSQIRDYIDQYVLLKKPVWKSEDYRQAFRQVPNLQDLVRNPFLLKLALGVLPEVLETNSRFSAARITRVKLYDRFVGQWIDSAKPDDGIKSSETGKIRTAVEFRFQAAWIQLLKGNGESDL